MKIHHPGDYRQRRAAAYPELTAQLAALWHAMDVGALPRIAAFYEPIAKVKARYRKPAAEAVDDGVVQVMGGRT